MFERPFEEKDLSYQPYLPEFIPELPWLQILNTTHNTSKFCSLSEELADQITAESRQLLPVDVRQIAKLFRIVKIIESIKGRAISGRMKPLSGEFSTSYFGVEINRFGTEEEKRFILAHEISHLWLRDYLKTDKHQPQKTPNWKESENYCDIFARMLLMPRVLLLPKIEALQDEHPLKMVFQLSQEFQVPFYVAAKRLVEDLGLIPGMIIGVPFTVDDHSLRGENGLAALVNLSDERTREKMAFRTQEKMQNLRNKFINPEVGRINKFMDLYVSRGLKSSWKSIFELNLQGLILEVEEEEEPWSNRPMLRPRSAAFHLQIGKKVAEVKDEEYFRGHLLFEGLFN